MSIFAPKNLNACETGSTVLAALLGLSPRRVQQLAVEGIISREGDNFRLAASVQAYISWLKASHERASPSAARERVLMARAEQLELANKQATHALIDTEEALAAVDEVVGAYRTELAGLPARLTRDLDKREEITREIDSLLARVSNIFANRAAELRAEGTLSVPAEDEE